MDIKKLLDELHQMYTEMAEVQRGYVGIDEAYEAYDKKMMEVAQVAYDLRSSYDRALNLTKNRF